MQAFFVPETMTVTFSCSISIDSLLRLEVNLSICVTQTEELSLHSGKKKLNKIVGKKANII